MRDKQAHLWDREPDNFYVEPEWCSRRLFEVERFTGDIYDPCAGFGRIVESAKAEGYRVYGSDLRERGFPGIGGDVDFFKGEGRPEVDNIVSNPPYGKRPDPLPGEMGRWEEEFIRLALGRARWKVAVFMDAGWANSAKRGAWLETLPLYRVYKVGPRPACPPGPFLQAGGKAGGGRIDFAWYVFLNGFDGDPTLHWLRRDG